MEGELLLAEKKSNFRWLVLALLSLNMFFVFLGTNSLPPLFTEIGEEIPITKAEMGTIMGVLSLPSLFLSLIGGGISDKVGSRWAFGVSILVVAVAGTLRSSIGSANGLIACMLLMGVGVAVLGPNLSKALGMWFPADGVRHG